MKYRPRRRPTEFDAVLFAESGRFPVKLRNVGSDGVRVTGLEGLVFPDSNVTLEVHGKRLPGRICWVDQHTAGVKFNAPMPKDIATLIARSTGGGGWNHRFNP